MVKSKNYVFLGLKLLIMVLFAATTIVPFYWVVVSSFKSNADIFGRPFAPPTVFLPDAFLQAWTSIDLARTFTNSMIYCLISIFLILLLGSMASYSLAKISPNKKLYAYFSFGILIPIHAVIIPLNILFNLLELGNGRTGLIIAFVVANLSLTIYIKTASIRTQPDELLQAGEIDGCGRVGSFFHIVLPVSKAALATAGTLAFVNCWNDFLLSLTITTTREIQTLNLAVFNLRSTYAKDYNILTAGITTMVVPAVIVYSVFQEQIIRGMVSGAVKG